MKLLTNDQAKRKLQKKLDKMYSKAEQHLLEFGVDQETSTSYTWRFRDSDAYRQLTCCLRKGTILETGSRY